MGKVTACGFSLLVALAALGSAGRERSQRRERNPAEPGATELEAAKSAGAVLPAGREESAPSPEGLAPDRLPEPPLPDARMEGENRFQDPGCLEWDEILRGVDDPETERESLLFAIWSLGQARTERAWQFLSDRFLDHPDEEIRLQAVNALLGWEDQEVCRRLVVLLGRDRSEQVRIAAAFVLAEMKEGGEETSRALATAFDRAGSIAEGEALAAALGRQGSALAQGHLLEAALSNRRDDLRARAALELHRSADARVAARLDAAARAERSDVVREAMAEAAKQIRGELDVKDLHSDGGEEEGLVQRDRPVAGE